MMPAATIGRPPTLRWKCSDFHRAGDFGLFEGRGALLIDGVILEEGWMSPAHAMTLQLTNDALRRGFPRGFWIRQRFPLPLNEWTEPMPDFAIVAGDPRSFAKAHPTTASLVIEISDTTFDFDTDEKRLLYATAGIPEYWVVDVNGRRLLVCRNPVNGDYPAPQVLVQTDVVTPLAASATVRVADLLA
jgi:Uma2 family endonuclease